MIKAQDRGHTAGALPYATGNSTVRTFLLTTTILLRILSTELIMSAFTGATTAAQAKDRNYLQLSNSLARLSRAVGQTTDLFELLKADLDAMKVLSASHAAQYVSVLTFEKRKVLKMTVDL